MKSIVLSTAILIAAGSAAAAGPAKAIETVIGRVWADQNGMTLYTFDQDGNGKSNCYDQCARSWPPFTAPGDARAEGKWTIVERTDGGRMWAYDGRPLYTWTKDRKPGDVTGDGVGDIWRAAKAE
jgi:predicted lipoprotein with Yx(FWY)xxD motif